MKRAADLIGSPTLIFHLAKAWRARARGRFAEAAKAYRSAVALAPDRTNLRVQLGNMLKDDGRRAEAEGVYRDAIARDGAHAETHLQLGHVLKLMGRREEALAAYRTALDLDPGLIAAEGELFVMGDPAALRAAYERQARDGGPQALTSLAYPVECYDQIRRLYEPPPPEDDPSPPPSLRIGVLLAAEAARNLDVFHRQLAALKAQTHADHMIAVFGSEPDRRAIVERAAIGDDRIRWIAGDDRPLAIQERAAALSMDADWVVLLAAGARLHPRALAWVAAIARRAACDAVFFDEEVAEGEALRPAPRQTFDADSLLEVNIYGETLAVAVTALAGIAEPAAARSLTAARSAILLALSSGRRIAHAPLPLVLREGADLTDAAAAAIEHAAAVRAHLGSGRASGMREAPAAVISVVIPTKDNYADLTALVGSLLDLADRPEAVRILILNNGLPEFRQVLETAFRGMDSVSVTDAQAPFNWSRLSNLGAAMTSGSYLLFANDDMRMLTRGWDGILRTLLERPDVGAVGAKLLYPDGAVQHAGMLFAWRGEVVHDGLYEPMDSPGPALRWRLTRSVSAVTGAFLGIRREVFDAVGGFDEVHLPISYSDVDLSLKLRAKGLRVLWTPAIRLHHFESKTRGFDGLDPAKAARDAAERRVLERRWPGVLSFEPSLNPAWSDAALPHRLLRVPTREAIWRYIEASAAENPWLTPPPASL